MDKYKEIIFFFTALLMLTPAEGSAGLTQRLDIDSSAMFGKGELLGTVVYSDGSVGVGVLPQRIKMSNVTSAYSLARDVKRNVAFIGTGREGKIYKLEGKNLRPFAETKQLLVSALALDASGNVYAGTSPSGIIYKVSPQGKMQRLVQIQGVEHIWSLLYDGEKKTLYAGTGPKGQVFSVSTSGKATPYYKTDATHVMCLAKDKKGNLLAGTSEQALLYRILAANKAEIVFSFPGDELTRIDVYQDSIAVVSNQFGRGTSSSFGAGKLDFTKPAVQGESRPGTGELWRIGANGRAVRLHLYKGSYLTSVQIGNDGAVYAGTGDDGRIMRVTDDLRSSIWADVEERQVLAMDLRSANPIFVTGDPGNVYTVEKGNNKSPSWLSDIYDAQFLARWGRLTWRSKGTLSFQTRSGNTPKPDSTWSAWSRTLNAPGGVPSPSARYIQVKATFPSAQATTRLYAVNIYYLPDNQPAHVIDVRVIPSSPPKPVASVGRSDASASKIKLRWDVENPDNDPLRYRLRFRNEQQDVWRSILPESQPLSESEYTWDTSTIPDGYYVVEVEGSDEMVNTKEQTQRKREISEPIRVDNHAPTISRLKWTNSVVTGQVSDRVGPISLLEYSVDGGSWRVFTSSDGLLDAPVENFSLSLKSETKPHIVAIRATDLSGNSSIAEMYADK